MDQITYFFGVPTVYARSTERNESSAPETRLP